MSYEVVSHRTDAKYTITGKKQLRGQLRRSLYCTFGTEHKICDDKTKNLIRNYLRNVKIISTNCY